MKTMKVLSGILFVLMLGLAPDTMAQNGGVSVKLNNAGLRGNALNIDADLKIGPVHLGRYESLSLTLVLKGTGKGQILKLPPVIVSGGRLYVGGLLVVEEAAP